MGQLYLITDERVPVLNLAGVIATRKGLEVRLRGLVRSDKMISRDAAAIANIGGKEKRRHVIRSSYYNKNSSDGVKTVRNLSVFNIDELVKNSVLIESEQNMKPNKQHVKAYHRFYVPVRTNDGTYTMRIVAEEATDSDGLKPISVTAYDVVIDKESPVQSPAALTENGGTAVIRTNEGINAVTIREMLSGVEGMDAEGQRRLCSSSPTCATLSPLPARRAYSHDLPTMKFGFSMARILAKSGT